MTARSVFESVKCYVGRGGDLLAIFSRSCSVVAALRPLYASFFAICVCVLAISVPLEAHAASVVQVTSTSPDGSYRVGNTITIDVSFSENVTVTGTPQLRLETGASDALINYSSGSGTSTLRFTYTVASGHTTSDLDYQSQSALSLNGGTIRNSSNVAASITLPVPGAAGSLGSNKNIRIDTSAPTVSITALTPLTSNTQPLRVQVIFSEAVSDFTPLDPTVTNGEISGFSGSGSSYTLDITPYVEGNIVIQIPANSAFDSALNGNTASSTLTFRYDTTVPLVSQVTASPTTSAYRAGLSANLIVVFSEAVTVTGTPSFSVETGASDGVATYLSGSGTTQLTFRYTVQAGHTSADLDYTAADALVLNGGSIRDAATNNAVLSLPVPGMLNSLSANANIVIDTTLPDVTITSTISGTTSLDAIPVEVVFSEPVTGFSLSDFAVTNGCASNLRGSGTTYYADIVPRVHGTVTVAIPGSIAVDVAGNPNTAAPSAVSVDFFTFGPKVTSVTSSTPNGAYRAGQTISIQVSFSDPVTVSGTPQLRLATGSVAVVNYTSGSGTDTLTFDYTIASGQNSSDLDYIPLPPLALSGGQIRDLATESFDAAFTFACPGASGSLASSKNIIVDTIAPTISRVTSTTTNGAYRADQTLNVRTQFSENIFVTGTPTLTLETGPNDAVISMVSGSGSANLDFSYTVVDGHNSNRLDYANSSAFSFNGSTIVDQAGNVAVVTLPTPGSTNSLFGQKSLIIDTIPPIVPNVTSSTANGSYKAGSSISIQVGFSETIFVTNTPRIALATGVPNRFASYSSGNATSTLTFNYTVGAGDTTSDLDYTGTSALEANGGTIRDQAGNDAVIVLAQPGAQFSLSFNKNLQLDTTSPTILSVTSTIPSGSYSIGTTIPISVLFSEPVNVTGVPYMLLNTTPSLANATYVSGTGTSTLIFSYTVVAGNNSLNLDYTNTAALILPAGATIRDPAINDAVTTLATPGTVGSLSAQAQRTIDTTVPTVTDISFVTPNGAYRAGSLLEIDITFSEAFALNGSLQLQLSTNSPGGVATCAALVSASSLRCTYTVQPGDTSNDLDYQSTNSLTLSPPSSALIDSAGNSADLLLPIPGTASSLAGKSSIILDTTAPIAAISSTTQPTTNSNPIPMVITFSEAISGLAIEDFTVANGTLQNLTGAGSSFTAELVPQNQGTVTITLSTLTVTDAAGNLNAVTAQLQRTYDSIRPTVRIDSSTAETSNTSSIPATITFSEVVTGFDVSDISITNGTLSSFLGSGRTYTVQMLPTTDGAIELFIPENVADDAGGNGNESSDSLSRFYDSTPPRVVSVRSSNADGFYREGATIQIEVECSEPVFITGSPRLALATGSAPRWAQYVTGSGTNTLTFRYTVANGDSSLDLDYPDTNALVLDSGTISDLATNLALTSLPSPGSARSLGGQNEIVIDTEAPAHPHITSPTSSSTIERAHVDIQGQAEVYSAISVLNLELQSICSTTTSQDGTWSCLLSNLDDGAYEITAVAKDRAGNDSKPSDQVAFVIDLLALDAPVFAEPASGVSTEQNPIFAGTAPPNKKVRVRSGATTLCLTQVSSTGAWSCQSSVALSPGRHAITGTTEDPADLTTSAATPLSLTIGSRLTGIVLHANRHLTPCKGVSVSDSVLSTTTSTDGVFSLVVPDPSDPKILLSKFGWQIKRSDTLSERAIRAGAAIQWLATPVLETDSFTVWNGDLDGMIQHIRVLNKSSDQHIATATLYQSDGTACSETLSTSVNTRTTELLDFSRTSCFRENAYGLVKITFPTREYDAALITSPRTDGLDTFLVSYNELPIANTLTGRSYTFFDTAYHRIRRKSESFTLRNDLLVGNPTQSQKSFTVRRYLSNGTPGKMWRFTLPAMGSHMIPFIAADERAPQNGIQEVTPDDPQSPYIAVMIRSGEQPQVSPGKSGQFIHMNYTDIGSGTTRFARVQYLSPRSAVQYAEIANITDQQVNIRIKRIGTSGAVRPVIPLLLAPYETRKIRLSRLLEKYGEGVAEISSDTPDSILMNTVVKHYRPNNTLLSMKSLPIKETFGDLAYGVFSTQRRTNSKLKISNLGFSTQSATVACYARNQLVDARQMVLRAGQLEEVELKACFDGNSSGLVEVNSSSPGTVVADLLRFRTSEEINLTQRLR